MKPQLLVPLAFAALLGAAAPATLAAQDQHPSKGKIDDVERSADSARSKGSGGEVGGGFWFFDAAGDGLSFLFHAFVYAPRDTGQGYLAYPYADPASGETYVRRDVPDGRTFGSFSAAYFRDGGSTLRAGQFAVEWAGGMLHRTIEYDSYVEPKPDETDHLQLFRLSFAAVPPLGHAGYVKVGLGYQVVSVGANDWASGPELELGVQLFPKRPFGVAASARVAPLTWNGGPTWGVGFADLAGNGSLFVGRFELQAGYRWTRIGVGQPFSGPVLGMRIWF